MEEPVVSHLSDLEGLNSELEGFLSDLHGREEDLSSRIKSLEKELSTARSSAAAHLKALEDLRKSLAHENSRNIALVSERDDMRRSLEAATRQLEEAKTALSGKLEVLTERFEEAKASIAEKESQLKEAKIAAKSEAADSVAALQEAHAALAAETEKLSAALLSRDDFGRRLQISAELQEELKAAVAQKEAQLKEANGAAKLDAKQASAALQEARDALAAESAKLSAVSVARDDLERRLQASAELQEGLRSAIAEKESKIKGAKASAKAEAEQAAATLQEARDALAAESAKLSAVSVARDDLERRLQASAELLEESKASLGERDVLLKETRAAAREKVSSLASDLEKAQGAIKEQDEKISALISARDKLRAELGDQALLLKEEKASSDKKDILIKEARAAGKQKAAELLAAIEEARASQRAEAAKVDELEAERQSLLRQLEEAAARMEEEKVSSSAKDEVLTEARSAARQKEAELTAAIEEANAAQCAETGRANGLEAERQSLLRQLEELAARLDGERASSSAKDESLEEARAVAREKAAALAEAVKASEEQAGELRRKIDELKADLELERSNVKDREAQLQKASRLREGLEKKLDQAAQENSRSEEGYLLKIDLVKKEMRDQAKRADEMERKLAAAGARLEDAIDEAAKKEKLLSETEAALSEKEAQLKEASLRFNTLTKEFADMQAGSGHESAKKAREAAASMAARVEELENSLSQATAEHMEKFRAVQAELSAVKADLRSREEENAALLAKEETLSRELGDAEEKWKFSSAQLNNSASKLRKAENEIEIAEGRIKSLEEERDKFRAAAIKAETAASALASRESKARDGEAAGLMAALEEQAAKYTDLLRKYDDIILLNEKISHERAGLKAEADSLRSALETAQASADEQAGEKLGVQSDFHVKVRALETELKKKSFELQEALAAADSAAREAEELRNRIEEKEDEIAGESEAEKARYALLSERVHNAENLLKKKEFELEESREALSALEGECDMLRQSREALNEKYAREIQAENEQLKEAQAKIDQRDALIFRLTAAEDELKREADNLKKDKQGLLSLMRKKSGKKNAGKVSEAERLLYEKESRLVKLRAELDHTRAEKAELQGREKELREELKSRPYRAMLREAEEKLLIKEKMLGDVTTRMKRLGRDFEELKVRGQSAGAPGYLPDFEELVAGVAHQVANSISIIRSHAEFCAEAPDAAGARESLDVIVRNIVNLQKKIDLIMNFSKPVIPQRSPERLSAVVHEVVDNLKASGRLEKMRFRVKGGDRLKPVSIDRVRFVAAAEQLILNAAEAMPKGGEIGVSISSSAGRQRLEVSDKGPGIEKKNMGSVFHPFFTTRHGKMGLGLTLARNVARAHGGSLDLHSDPGKGTRAVMELPEIS